MIPKWKYHTREVGLERKTQMASPHLDGELPRLESRLGCLVMWQMIVELMLLHFWHQLKQWWPFCHLLMWLSNAQVENLFEKGIIFYIWLYGRQGGTKPQDSKRRELTKGGSFICCNKILENLNILKPKIQVKWKPGTRDQRQGNWSWSHLCDLVFIRYYLLEIRSHVWPKWLHSRALDKDCHSKTGNNTETKSEGQRQRGRHGRLGKTHRWDQDKQDLKGNIKANRSIRLENKELALQEAATDGQTVQDQWCLRQWPLTRVKCRPLAQA